MVYKEKQLKRKEHKLKIIPVGGEAIVLALQSKEQTEQWLRVSRVEAGLLLNFAEVPEELCSFGEATNQPSLRSSGDPGDQSQTSRKL